MKPLEIKYTDRYSQRPSGHIDTEATLQAIIDRVNELSEDPITQTDLRWKLMEEEEKREKVAEMMLGYGQTSSQKEEKVSHDCRHCEVAEQQGVTHIHAPKRFKAEELEVFDRGLFAAIYFNNKAEAEEARNLLINL